MPLWAALVLIFIAYVVGVFKGKVEITKELVKAEEEGKIQVFDNDRAVARTRLREVISSLL